MYWGLCNFQPVEGMDDRKKSQRLVLPVVAVLEVHGRKMSKSGCGDRVRVH